MHLSKKFLQLLDAEREAIFSYELPNPDPLIYRNGGYAHYYNYRDDLQGNADILRAVESNYDADSVCIVLVTLPAKRGSVPIKAMVIFSEDDGYCIDVWYNVNRSLSLDESRIFEETLKPFLNEYCKRGYIVNDDVD